MTHTLHILLTTGQASGTLSGAQIGSAQELEYANQNKFTSVYCLNRSGVIRANIESQVEGEPLFLCQLVLFYNYGTMVCYHGPILNGLKWGHSL